MDTSISQSPYTHSVKTVNSVKFTGMSIKPLLPTEEETSTELEYLNKLAECRQSKTAFFERKGGLVHISGLTDESQIKEEALKLLSKENKPLSVVLQGEQQSGKTRLLHQLVKYCVEDSKISTRVRNGLKLLELIGLSGSDKSNLSCKLAIICDLKEVDRKIQDASFRAFVTDSTMPFSFEGSTFILLHGLYLQNKQIRKVFLDDFDFEESIFKGNKFNLPAEFYKEKFQHFLELLLKFDFTSEEVRQIMCLLAFCIKSPSIKANKDGPYYSILPDKALKDCCELIGIAPFALIKAVGKKKYERDVTRVLISLNKAVYSTVLRTVLNKLNSTGTVEGNLTFIDMPSFSPEATLGALRQCYYNEILNYNVTKHSVAPVSNVSLNIVHALTDLRSVKDNELVKLEGDKLTVEYSFMSVEYDYSLILAELESELKEDSLRNIFDLSTVKYEPFGVSDNIELLDSFSQNCFVIGVEGLKGKGCLLREGCLFSFRNNIESFGVSKSFLVEKVWKPFTKNKMKKGRSLSVEEKADVLCKFILGRRVEGNSLRLSNKEIKHMENKFKVGFDLKVPASASQVASGRTPVSITVRTSFNSVRGSKHEVESLANTVKGQDYKIFDYTEHIPSILRLQSKVKQFLFRQKVLRQIKRKNTAFKGKTTKNVCNEDRLIQQGKDRKLRDMLSYADKYLKEEVKKSNSGSFNEFYKRNLNFREYKRDMLIDLEESLNKEKRYKFKPNIRKAKKTAENKMNVINVLF